MKVNEIISEEIVNELSLGGAGKAIGGAVTAGRSAIKGVKASSARNALVAKRADVVANAYGSAGMNLLYALNIAKEVINYNYEVSQLDQSDPEYQKKLMILRGQFITAVLAPKVAMWAANKLYLTKIVGALPWLMKTLRFPNAAAITKQLTTRGVEAALLVFLSTDAGKQWITNFLGEWIIGGVGNLPALAATITGVVKDVAVGMYKAATGSEEPVAGAGGTVTNPVITKANMVSIIPDPKNPKIKFIGGKQVTGPDGFVLTTIPGEIKDIRLTARALKQPDPFASLEFDPAKQYPGISK